MKRFSVLPVLALSLVLQGCYGPFLYKITGGESGTIDEMAAPVPYGMGRPDNTAPPEYLKGWDDGCKTGLSTMNLGSYKGFYKYTVTQDLYTDPRYYKAWKDAYTYCRQYSFKWTMEPIDRQYSKSGPLCLLCPNEVGR